MTDVRDKYAAYGGGVYVERAEVEVLAEADIFRNVAVREGGGLYLDEGATWVVRGAGTVIGTGYGNSATNVMGKEVEFT